MLAADFDERLGLVTCERGLFSQSAKHNPVGKVQWTDIPKEIATKER